MGVVFLSYPDDDVRRGWYVVDVDGVAAGPFGRAMGLDLLTAIEARELETTGLPLIRRILPRDVLDELRRAARAGLAATILSEERLDLVDGVPAAAATASPATVRNGPA